MFVLIIICAALMIAPRLHTKDSIVRKQLYTAICNSNIQGVKEAIVKDKSIVNERMGIFERRKPLELAVQEIESEQIQLEICSMLIDAGTDVNEAGADQDTILDWAFQNDRMYLAEKLMQAGAKPKKHFIFKQWKEMEDSYGTQYLFIPQILKRIPNVQTSDHISSALYAAMKGNNGKLQEQIQSGNIKEAEKHQVMAFAAAYCDIDTLKLMRERGYDFSWKDADKVGMIHIAALCNQTEVVQYLLEEGLRADDKIKDYQADALAFAILGNHPGTVQLLLQRGNADDKSLKSKGDDTVWAFVSAYGNEKALQFLLESGYRLQEEELTDLISDGKSDLVQKALEEKQTQGKIRKEVLLQAAVNIGDFSMVRYLIENGASMNEYVEDDIIDYKSTAMHSAYAGASVEIRKYLEEKGGDPSRKDSDGADAKTVADEEEAVWNMEKQIIISEKRTKQIKISFYVLMFVIGMQMLYTMIQIKWAKNFAGKIADGHNINEYVNDNKILLRIPNGIMDFPFFLGEKLYLYDLEVQKRYLVSKKIGIYSKFGTALTLAGCHIYYNGDELGEEFEIYEKEIGNVFLKTKILKQAERYAVDCNYIYYLNRPETLDDESFLYRKDKKSADCKALLEGELLDLLRIDNDRLYTWDNVSEEAIEMQKDGSGIIRCPEIKDPAWIGHMDPGHYLIIEADRIICYDKKNKTKECIAEGEGFSGTARYDKKTKRLYYDDKEMNFYWVDTETKTKKRYLALKQQIELKDLFTERYDADVYYCKDYLAVDITKSTEKKRQRHLFVYDYEGRKIRKFLL